MSKKNAFVNEPFSNASNFFRTNNLSIVSQSKN